jgi:hypothetical protein
MHSNEDGFPGQSEYNLRKIFDFANEGGIIQPNQ